MARKCLLHEGEIEDDVGHMYLIIDSRKYYVCEPCVRSNSSMTYKKLKEVARCKRRLGVEYEKFNRERAQAMVDECALEMLRRLMHRPYAAM